ncbi:MAG: ABC transporter substrate-binding protein [Clostridiales bacterium]|nr:ABC transporter substrate-binding protein [Clostridiales bacterium]
MKKITGILSLVMVLTIIATGFSACGGNGDADKNTLVIGGIGPLTGDYSTYGVSVKQGAQIAVDEINAAGGVNAIKFELKFEDDETDATKAVNAYNTLMDDGMKVSLGAVTSGACIAVTEEAKKDGILLLTPSGSQKECTQYDNCFRICFTDPQQGTVSADYIADNLTAKKIAIIYDKSNDYSVGITDKFVAEAAVKGLEIVAKQAFTSGTSTDFSAQLQQVKDTGAELVFLPIYAKEAAFILKQAKTAGIAVPFFGCDGLDGILEKLGTDNQALANGVMLLTPFAADADDTKTKNFVKVYGEKYNGQVPDQFAADGYDAIYTIKAAIEKAGINDINAADFNTKIIDAMTQVTVEGLTGTMVWDESGDASKDAKAVKITDGTYVAI